MLIEWNVRCSCIQPTEHGRAYRSKIALLSLRRVIWTGDEMDPANRFFNSRFLSLPAVLFALSANVSTGQVTIEGLVARDQEGNLAEQP